MAKFSKVFSLSDLGIKDIESLTSKQKAKAIRDYVAAKGDKLDSKVRGRALMRAGRYENESGTDTPKKAKSAPKKAKKAQLKNVRKGSIVLSGYIHSVATDGTSVFTRGDEVLYGISPEEMKDFQQAKLTVIEGTKPAESPVTFEQLNDQTGAR